jgi:hypothetical protein
MQTELLHLRVPARAAHGRIQFHCEQLERRDVPSAATIASVPAVPSPAAELLQTSHVVPSSASTAALDGLFSTATTSNGFSEAAYAQALQSHPAAVLQDFAAPDVVARRGSTTSLVASARAVQAGQTITLTATVTASGVATKPGGTVTFKDGSQTLGTATLVNGVARFSWRSQVAETHRLTAVYSGGGAVRASTSAAVSVTVSAVASKARTQLATPYLSNAHPTAGSTVTLYASLNILSGGSSALPGGTVTFKDGSRVLGTVALNPHGRTELSGVRLAAGTHAITAAYSGDAHYAGSTSPTLSVSVSQAATAKTPVRLSAPALSVSPAVAGAPLTFSVSLTPGASSSFTPSGTVTFKDGGKVLGIVRLNTRGKTTFTVSGLTAGSHSITAVYSGDGHFQGATSPATTVRVSAQSGRSPVQVTLENLGDVTRADRSLVFLVRVTAASGTPGGLVILKDGSQVLGEIDLDRSGTAALARGIGLPPGRHTITATFEGSASYAAGSASLSLSLS